MIWFIGVMLIIAGIMLFYALVLRPWLKTQAWAVNFFAWIDPLELALFKKSETILAGRIVWLGGAIVTIYDGAVTCFSNLDATPITTRIFDALQIPQDIRGLVLSASLTGLGLMIVNLRKKTTKPLELVAVSNANVTPAAAQAIANADVAKDVAVQAVAKS